MFTHKTVLMFNAAKQLREAPIILSIKWIRRLAFRLFTQQSDTDSDVKGYIIFTGIKLSGRETET